MTGPSIHDNFVLGYTVDVEARALILRTEYRDRQPFERTDVHFGGVLGYLILDSLGGILLDIVEVDFEAVYRERAPWFEAMAKHAWPFQGEGSEDPVAFVERTGAATYEILSSIGFHGFVVCTSMHLAAVHPGPSAPDRSGRVP